ncbi:hypothetical protein ES703_75385 [subsurface metagenome]
MDAEERTKEAINRTRAILREALDDSYTIIIMTAKFVEPEEIEDKIAEILEYLDKTAPE